MQSRNDSPFQRIFKRQGCQLQLEKTWAKTAETGDQLKNQNHPHLSTVNICKKRLRGDFLSLGFQKKENKTHLFRLV